MPANKTWQQLERFAASIFGTTRNPLSGANNRSDDGSKRIGDVISRDGDLFFVECKHRKKWALESVFEEAQKDAPDKVLFLFTHQKGEEYEDSLVAMRASTFALMWPLVADQFTTKPVRMAANRLPPDERAFRRVLHNYKARAKMAKIPFALTNDQFKRLIESNCHWCGSEPSNVFLGFYQYNGIDRLNPEDGYTPENCVPSCFVCNRAKSILSPDAFMEWIRKAYNHLFL